MKKQNITKIITIILAMLTFSPLVNAATIQGSVYDIFLEELDKAIITVDTEPKQMAVSKDGSYSFEIPPGEYTILATYYGEEETYELEEGIKINEGGVYTLDLILTPVLGDDILGDDVNNFGNFSEDNLNLDEEKESSNLGIIITIIALLIIISYLHFAKSHFIKDLDESNLKSETEEDLEKLLKFLKEQGGRSTQKEIRKKFPSSEAKISLMITELESKKLVKKIKKGRGNIIILTKK
ncbi:hypothetical protein HOA88_03430 [Candidatus Woesearchaeota archaeon]|jgi:uncharacterized membrane protein|nr:hypothetical protein [Candidatus Woesearchaeota archaeon]MBT4783039.1 hypothetical protein [Candidatus Woesearchaeota archaeon]MBT6761295.1 hypothetical protein [Candidatus Woesearchaeota archaeon]MBT7148833.1 hypothetical protein [Candidatus Woesearchaeota archaeon]MBT7555411.1 hypothetical protein [Candidatus Woesearchaeota archaeon]